MKRLVSALCALALALPGSAAIVTFANVPAHAQSEQAPEREMSMPTGSRIAREIPRQRMTTVNRDRRSGTMSRYAACAYESSPELAARIIYETDYGFSSFEQFEVSPADIFEELELSDCLGEAVRRSGRSIQMGLRPGNLRFMMLQHDYFARFPDGASWVATFTEAPERVLPLSANNSLVRSSLFFADCVVDSDPVAADFYYRTEGEGDLEDEALEQLMPSLGPCLPEGSQIELSPYSLRVLLGEGLHHAAINTLSAAPETPQEAAE